MGARRAVGARARQGAPDGHAVLDLAPAWARVRHEGARRCRRNAWRGARPAGGPGRRARSAGGARLGCDLARAAGGPASESADGAAAGASVHPEARAPPTAEPASALAGGAPDIAPEEVGGTESSVWVARSATVPGGRKARSPPA